MFFKSSLILLITILIVSCKKETVNDAAPSLIGTWKHYSAVDAWHIIYIYDDSTGKMEWFTNSKLSKDTKIRTWYWKNNTIYFGKAAFNGEFYEIIDYPTVSGSTNIELFDTLYQGKKFMKIDQSYYVEI